MQEGPLEPGVLVASKYVVERVLGRGGMGTVYAVTHHQTGKRLALKCLLPSFVENQSVVERFIREAKAVGRIQHRHVIDVFDQGRDGDVLYIVLPLLEGKPLSELLHDENLTLEEALVILVRAMEGVAAAHAIGVLHRDLKPANIFVCVGVSGRLDDPRVLDFGISKLDDEVGSPLTRSGVAVGTPYYMAIEQLTGQRDLDQRVDVYAMGVILYQALAGVVPYSAENVASLAITLMHIPAIHLRVRRPDLPDGLADVVMCALARDRSGRYPTIRSLIDALLPFIPASAGLRVPEPQGRPLRTPRDTSEPYVPDLVRASAATAPAGALPLPWTPSSPAPATPAPSAAPPGGAHARSARARIIWLAAAVALGTGASLATWQSADTAVRGARAGQTDQIAVRVPAPAKLAQRADDPAPVAPTALPAQRDVDDAGSETQAERERTRERRAGVVRRPIARRAATTSAAESTSPQTTPKETDSREEPRAGSLEPDEF